MAIDIVGTGNTIVAERAQKIQAQIRATEDAVSTSQTPVKLGLSANSLTQNAIVSINGRGAKLDLAA